MADVHVRAGSPDDLDALRAMNDLEVPRVNVLSPALFAQTTAETELFVVTQIDRALTGFA